MSGAAPARRALGWLGQFFRRHLGTVLVCVGVFTAVHFWQARALPTGEVVDFQMRLIAPDAPLQVTTLASWRARHPGQTTAIYIWADWCPVCKAMAPNVTALAQDHPVLTVAMRSGDANRVQQHLRQRGLNWVVAVDEDGDLAQRLAVSAVPTFLVLAPDGSVQAPSVGYTTTLGLRARMWWVALWTRVASAWA